MSNVDCPVNPEEAAGAIALALHVEGWDAATAELSARLATGHVAHFGRWYLLGFDPDRRDMRLPVLRWATYEAETAETWVIPTVTVAWGRTWTRPPAGSGVTKWNRSYRFPSYLDCRDHIWLDLFLAAARAIADEVALGRDVSHVSVKVTELEATQEVCLHAFFEWAEWLMDE